MPVIAESGFFFKMSHRGKDFETGPTFTIDHNVAVTGSLSIHVGLSLVQATTGGPLSAAVGIMKFGDEDLGPDPFNWATARYGRIGSWTTAAHVTKGDLLAWEFVQVWA
jgi:hypothetical protein